MGEVVKVKSLQERTQIYWVVCRRIAAGKCTVEFALRNLYIADLYLDPSSALAGMVNRLRASIIDDMPDVEME